jgi:hypothetical protein
MDDAMRIAGRITASAAAWVSAHYDLSPGAAQPYRHPARQCHLQGQHRTDRRASDSDGSPGRVRRRGTGRQRRSRPSPALPLLRRPHDHRPELWARRRTPRPAIPRSRGQGHDAMTPITASLHIRPAGEPHFRCRIAVAPPPPKAPGQSGMPPFHPIEPIPTGIANCRYGARVRAREWLDSADSGHSPQ